MTNSLSSLLAQTTGSSPLKPIVNIAISPTNGAPGFTNSISTTILKLPSGGGTTPTYTGTNPGLGGSSPSLGGGGSGSGTTPSAGGNAVGSISSGAVPTNTPLLGQQVAASPTNVITFTVSTIFPTPALATGATAVTYSASGSPAWAGISVPANGYFSLKSSLLSNGDIVQVKVIPGSPGTANDAGISNPLNFNVLSNSVTVISNTTGGAQKSDNIAAALVDGTNIYYTANNINGFSKLFKIATASGDTLTQVIDMRGSLASDAPLPLGGFNGAFYFANNVASGSVSKIFKVTSGGTTSQISNTAGNQTFTDAPTNIAVAPLTGSTPGLVINSKFYFAAANTSGNQKLFCIDTSDVVTQVSNTKGTQTGADNPANGIVFNGNLYLSMVNASGGTKLFKVDSSNTVTQISNTSGSQSTTDTVVPLGIANSLMYFKANNSSGVVKLYSLSTSDVITQVSNISGSQSLSDNILSAGATFNNFFYFIGSISQNSGVVLNKLLRVNAAGVITQMSNTNGAFGSDSPTASTLTALSDGVYCAMIDTIGSIRMFRSDASGVLTQIAAPRSYGPDNSTLQPVEPVSGQGIYFQATGATSNKLFKVLDGSYCYQISDFNPSGSDNLAALPLFAVNGAFYAAVATNPGANNSVKWVKYT